MIGIVIVTHGQLGDALVEAAELILAEKQSDIVSVSINLTEPSENLRVKIEHSIKKVHHQHGVLILTDMFGGTPSNLSYSFLEEGKIEVISGVNLPIVIKAIENRDKTDLTEVAKNLEEQGKKSITLASLILKGNKRK